MSPTQKAPKKPAKKPAKKASRASQQAHALRQENERLIRRITDSLDVAQADLAKLRGDVAAGVSDMRRELSKLLRDARRNAIKMGNATRKDLERLQKDMVAATKPKPRSAGAAKARARKPKARASRGR